MVYTGSVWGGLETQSNFGWVGSGRAGSSSWSDTS
ncbi:uncharacterized protein G2W53_025033 [Senna tora]|uniref:Uncharacterized protein n=1 Tax=Senna tora TaxID=362788 RepID=A0A834TCP6_9FABA|nr:uncharacterized protein G2W53_025033 [Senna tora]